MYRGERFNSISHLAGTITAAGGLTLLILKAVQDGDPWKITAFSMYGISLLLLYLQSTLYHSIQGRIKPVLQKLDHIAIYLLIAGTYTPFTLITLRGLWGWILFGTVWSLAALGIVIDLLHRKGRRIVPLVLYLIMGWLCVLALRQLWTALSAAGFLWLAAGGIFYTTGIIFYALDKRIPHAHGIWHLFVMAGSLCHYLSILIYVA